MAPGISEALIATAAGLGAAIPAVMGYNFFVNRVEALGDGDGRLRARAARTSSRRPAPKLARVPQAMAIKHRHADDGERQPASARTLAEINIIPLVDVVLVLLLIFMLTAPLMYRGIDVNLPKTSGKPTAVEERMVLTLTKEQPIYLNDKPVALGRARADAARRSSRTARTRRSTCKADQALQYGFVVETMDRVRRAGIEKLGMVTEPVRGSMTAADCRPRYPARHSRRRAARLAAAPPPAPVPVKALAFVGAGPRRRHRRASWR